MDLKISKAKEQDFAYIQEKIGKYLLDEQNIHWQEFFAARLKEKVVSFGRILDHGDSFEIASLGVDYYHRKKGIGKQMLSFLIRQAEKIDARKPIYGVTHLPDFVGSCGFVEVSSDCPEYLDHKRKYGCHLDQTRIKIMKWSAEADKLLLQG